jgi:hypothetical protein
VRTRWTLVLLAGALTLAPQPSWTEGAGGSLEEHAAETASTPSDHAALATYYRAQAQEARNEAQRHETMGRAYLGGKNPSRPVFKEHCQKISEKYTALAEEYDALAKLHEAEAGKPQ